MSDKQIITVETTVAVPAKLAWECWTSPEHIMRWNNASDDWHTPKATVDLREGGSFTSRMEAKDGSAGFDFRGTYTKILMFKHIDFTLDDKRNVSISFDDQNGQTHIKESFETEHENSIEMQKQGWQAILDNYKQYTESLHQQ